jgi:hypothetical protein
MKQRDIVIWLASAVVVLTFAAGAVLVLPESVWSRAEAAVKKKGQPFTRTAQLTGEGTDARGHAVFNVHRRIAKKKVKPKGHPGPASFLRYQINVSRVVGAVAAYVESGDDRFYLYEGEPFTGSGVLARDKLDRSEMLDLYYIVRQADAVVVVEMAAGPPIAGALR